MNNMIKILIASIILALVSGAAASAETLRGTVTELHPVYAEHVSKTPCQKGYTEQVFIPANATHTVRNVGSVGNIWYYGYKSVN